MIPPPSLEFVMVAIACGVATGVAVYMAGRHNARVVDYAYIVKEGDDMGDDTQLSLEDAVANRDAVLEGVADNNADWLQRAIEAMGALPDGTEATGEGFRFLLLKNGLKSPTHVNAWGSLFMTLTRRKMLVATGEYRPMLAAKSHARKTPVYILRMQSEAA